MASSSGQRAGPGAPSPVGRVIAAAMSPRGFSLLMFIAGVAALAAALLSGGMAAQERRAASQELYAHTLEVMASARELLSSVQDIETGHRGYLLARDERYLEPWIRAEAGIEQQIAHYRALTVDNPGEQAAVSRLESLVAELRTGVAASIALGRSGDFESALADFRSDDGKRLMDDIRGAVSGMLDREAALLLDRREEAAASARVYGGYLTGLLLLGLALILFAIYSSLSAAAQAARADLEAERAAAAQAQADSDRRFRTMTDAMPQIVFAAQADGRFDFVNARWREFTGAAGTQQTWIDHIHPDDRGGVATAWRRSLETGEGYEREVRLRDAHGAYRWFLCRAVPLRNADGEIESWLGAGADIHEARLHMEARELISQELNHRIKNIFSVVTSLITLSARSDPTQGEFARALRDRIMALARAHEFVRPKRLENAEENARRSFSAFLHELLRPYHEDGEDRIRISGDDFSFGDKSATAFALYFHELGTNAAKYGALSQAGGRIDVIVRRKDGDIVIDWTETHGPPVHGPPEREGFGATLARLSIEGQLDGSQTRDWSGQGLKATIRIPETALR